MPDPESVSYRQLIEDATDQLRNTSDSAKLDAEILLQHTSQLQRAWLIAHSDDIANPKHVQQFYQLLKKRLSGEPIAYLVGYKDFWSLRLKVNEHVLIPRADTETLVEQALARLDRERDYTVLDLGTGSGAIALTIAKERPRAQIVAVDIKEEAIDVAKTNCIEAGLSNVEFIQGDWFNAIAERKFDLILSNPPYVAAKDSHLTQGDLRFEPSLALVGGDDGLQDLGKIIQNSTQHIHAGGWLIVEHGFDQQSAVSKMFTEAGYSAVNTYTDLNKLPRCTAGQWPDDKLGPSKLR